MGRGRQKKAVSFTANIQRGWLTLRRKWSVGLAHTNLTRLISVVAGSSVVVGVVGVAQLQQLGALHGCLQLSLDNSYSAHPRQKLYSSAETTATLFTKTTATQLSIEDNCLVQSRLHLFTSKIRTVQTTTV
jgi:hypothetical protein